MLFEPQDGSRMPPISNVHTPLLYRQPLQQNTSRLHAQSQHQGWALKTTRKLEWLLGLEATRPSAQTYILRDGEERSRWSKMIVVTSARKVMRIWSLGKFLI